MSVGSKQKLKGDLESFNIDAIFCSLKKQESSKAQQDDVTISTKKQKDKTKSSSNYSNSNVKYKSKQPQSIGKGNKIKDNIGELITYDNKKRPVKMKYLDQYY